MEESWFVLVPFSAWYESNQKTSQQKKDSLEAVGYSALMMSFLPTHSKKRRTDSNNSSFAMETLQVIRVNARTCMEGLVYYPD